LGPTVGKKHYGNRDPLAYSAGKSKKTDLKETDPDGRLEERSEASRIERAHARGKKAAEKVKKNIEDSTGKRGFHQERKSFLSGEERSSVEKIPGETMPDIAKATKKNAKPQ